MNNPNASPFPSTFDSDAGDASPKRFLDFLKKLISQDLSDDSAARIPVADRDSWVEVITSLSDHFLTPLPSPQDVPWNAMHEKVKLVEIILDLLQRVTDRVDALYAGPGELAKKIFISLVGLCSGLDIWVEVDVSEEEGIPTPSDLRQKAFQAAVGILRWIGSNVTSVGGSEEPTWRILRNILVECLEVSHDMLSQATFPLAIKFFSKPRFQVTNLDNLLDRNTDVYVPIESTLQVPLFLSLLLDLLCNTVCPSLPCQCFLTDVILTMTEMVSSVLDYCFSPSCCTTPVRRLKSLTQVVISATSLLSLSVGFESAMDNLHCQLLRYRLNEGPNPSWDGLDLVLHQAFCKPFVRPPVKAVVTFTLDVLRKETWGDAGKGLRNLAVTYLRSCSPHFDSDTLRAVKDVSSVIDETNGSDFEGFDQQRTLANPVGGDPEKQFGEAINWRSGVKTVLQEILMPDIVSWMDDDETLSNVEYTKRVLHDLRHRFERPIHSSSSSDRIQLAEKLTKLTCSLAHPHCSECVVMHAELTVIFIPSYVAVANRLMDGSETDVVPLVRRRVYDALGGVVKHYRPNSVNNALTQAGEIAIRGMTDKDRSVRLSAGRVLNVLTRAHGSIGLKWTEILFASLQRILETATISTKETVLITMGSTGVKADGEVLRLSVCHLIAQLGNQNPVLRGTAYMQLIAVAKSHNKSPYALVSPYLSAMAPFLVSRICTHRMVLTETCRFLSVSPTDFIASTLSLTLPNLFANCDDKALETIAKELSKKLSILFLNFAREILAHVYLLSPPAQVNNAIAFILKVLRDAADNETIDLRSVVTSYVIPLLSELVVVMGDQDPARAKKAVGALEMVQRSLFVPTRGQRVSPAQTLGQFLEGYMLGLISDINEMLRDVQGKKTMSSKQRILRSLGALVTHIGHSINNAAPQIMAIFQAMLVIPELAEVTLESWCTFLSTVSPDDIYPHVGPTSASFVSAWPTFSPLCKDIAKQSLDYIVAIGEKAGKHMDEVVDLGAIPELRQLQERLTNLRKKWTPKDKLRRLLEGSSSDNVAVAVQSLRELKAFMLAGHQDFTRDISSGDIFDPLVGQILIALIAAACRDGDAMESLRLLAFECMGVLGAVDPDRCEFASRDTRLVVRHNFTDEGESVIFALHLITDLLVGVFRSTSDINHQNHLAYAIQELLKFCKFTPALVSSGSNTSIPLKVRTRWNSLQKHVLETVTPLLGGRFKSYLGSLPVLVHPIYSNQPTYHEWIQLWTSNLITMASGPTAKTIFGVLHSAVRNKDVGVAHHILPHLVLNILISGNEQDSQSIRSEILAVLEDQVNPDSMSSADKKLLSAQAVFVLLDHLSQWVRIVRQDISSKKPENKRSRNQIGSDLEEQLLRVDSILSSIDQHLMAKAALQCKAYARSLMNFERQIVVLQTRSAGSEDLPLYYERLHEIYAHLDEPDGMEGVSTLILSPSLEHQIRQHESTGRWTSAQSCWEVRLQQSPDNLDFHLGLLRCLRNLGHYDTLRTHVKGVLTRNPDWGASLAGFQVECAWMVGAWDDVKDLVDQSSAQTGPIVMARLLLSMRSGDPSLIAQSASAARLVLGTPITASGAKEYRRSYDAVLSLHLTHELEVIYNTISTLPSGPQNSKRRRILTDLSKSLAVRLNATLPTFRAREPVLSMRRVAFALASTPRRASTGEIGRSWLASAKIARKAGQWQTAYCSMLQAQQTNERFSFMESAKLVKATGEPLRALQELENSMSLLGLIENRAGIIDLTDDEERKRMEAKAQVLRARWMNESDRFETNQILKTFQIATELCPKWESGHFHLGQYHDECFKSLPAADQQSRGQRMNLYTVRFFAKAIRYGSKYVYQTVPRLLTLWLDMGESHPASDVFKKLNDAVSKAIKDTPIYKWYTAFPQIVSRVGHSNPEVYEHLSKIITMVLQEYPKQALWLFASVVKSNKQIRQERGQAILDQLCNNPANSRRQVSLLIAQLIEMTKELLALCDYRISDDSRKTLNMSRDFPRLAAMRRSLLIIPLQESLIANLPPNSSSESVFQPFPANAPTFESFNDEINIMQSLAKPRKITIKGSNGQIYMFLGKPKDDLRKDARLMDFNAIINKLLKANSESRRRQLHIRTYGVITLNEECGFIQWVPNTIPIRSVLIKGYDEKRIRPWYNEMPDIFKRIKELGDKDGGEVFITKILSLYPPVFHEWFIETFPEPTAWLASRLTYGRTAAVMSMVGFILGLGDRHLENILLDTNTGDVVHVDFNCLFEKGKTLETPERVPFRLTHNLIDGLGVTGVEGVFRIACEVTLQLLRDNKDSLMSVLDAFIHDPLVEWEDEKRKLDREPSRRNNVKASVNLHMLAKNALNPIEKKLKGIYSTSKERREKEISTSNLVQMLIQEATDPANLGNMYPGWAAWH